MHRLATIASVVLLLAPVARAQKAPAADPCALVTRNEVEAAFGAPVKDPKRTSLAGVGICTYEGANPHPYKSVKILLGPAGITRQQWEAQIKESAKTVPTSPQPLTGLGDAAFLWKGAIVEENVEVMKGQTNVTITVDTGSMDHDANSANTQIAKALAQKAVTRM